MSIGQFAEILTMAYLGFFIKKLGFKRVISLGIGAYFFRYLIFGTSSLPLWFIISSQALHGFCYAFFFAAAFIYVDKISEMDFRHSAQTVFGIIILGGGPVLGGWLSGFLQETFSNNNSLNFSSFWYSISLVGLIATLFFITLFKEQLNNKGN
jgi:MFS family permease